MSLNKSETWKWKNWEISWSLSKESTSEKNIKILLVHGFGASKNHWRHNQDFLGKFSNCYAIDLLGFGKSSQPSALLNYEPNKENSIKYSFDLWGNQISTFCAEVIIDKELIEILYQPSQRKNSKEAFRGFINLFDDYLATDLFDKVDAPIQLIWGEKDPWESLNEAKEWKKLFRNIKRLDIIKGAGHCPHDEEPEKTNKLINEFIQETK